ncbi:MAG: universal stress protein [Magnetococcales bacterium]|nr:universal stress protein [Magnetococcales bacterium]MBF0439854.1 universal stress protein [Magnetococcales bacterium]
MNDTEVAVVEPCKVILLATDGSEFSAGVERVGVEMAQQNQSQLFVLRLLLAESGTDEAIVEEQDAAISLERVTTQCAEQGVSCTTLIRSSNDPAQGILAAAKEVNAQLLIVGRRGRRGLAKLMVGDATTKIIDKAECSVLVVPRLFSYWRNGVLLALAEPPHIEGDKAAHAAFHLAQAAHLPLTVLLVDEENNEDERRDVYQSVNRLVAMAKLQDVAAEGLVQSGDIDEVIQEVARQRSADLIVCEPRDRSVIDRLFNVNKLVQLIGKAHCPVLVVQGPHAA